MLLISQRVFCSFCFGLNWKDLQISTSVCRAAAKLVCAVVVFVESVLSIFFPFPLQCFGVIMEDNGGLVVVFYKVWDFVVKIQGLFLVFMLSRVELRLSKLVKNTKVLLFIAYLPSALLIADSKL